MAEERFVAEEADGYWSIWRNDPKGSVFIASLEDGTTAKKIVRMLNCNALECEKCRE